MEAQEFREAAKAAIDEMTDYTENVAEYRVVSNVKPGYLRPLLPSSPPTDPEPWSAIHQDIESKILPGITHWSSPRFMAFFPCASSYPAALAEIYSNAFNGAHFNWICSPAVTELETIVMDWLAQALGLPECFLSGGSTHGGGVIHGSISESLIVNMAAARDRYLASVTAHLPPGSEEKDEALWNLRSRLVALGSSGTHSSTKKVAQVLGVRFATIPVSEADGLSLRGEALAATVENLRARGLEPFFLTATLGTTDVCAVDDFEGIAQALKPTFDTSRDIWVHIDAAYAGAALVLEEYQHLAKAFSSFHSISFSPHKWFLTTFDCTAVWVRHRSWLVQALSIKPPYLRNQFSDDELVTDYRDWQIPLGRRFRSLKLWFVMRSYGISGLQKHIRNGVDLAESLEDKIESRRDIFSVFTPARFGLITIRINGESEQQINDRTEAVYEVINAAGEFYFTATVVNDKFAIRVCTSVTKVEEQHVQRMFDVLVQTAETEIAKGHKWLECNL